MSLYAADDIEDAFTATRAFLTPFSAGRWAKLAFVVFFVGTGPTVAAPSFDVSVPGSSSIGSDVDFDTTATVPDDVWLVAGVVVATLLLVGLLWTLVGSILEFVLVESLRSREVTIRRYCGHRWRQGLRLFGFRVALGGAFLGLFGGWLALVVLPVLGDGGLPGWWFALLLLGIPLVTAAGLLFAVVSQFTTVFVVPVMIKTDAGVLGAWRQLWPSLRADWKEYLVYAIVAAVLTGVLGALVSLALGVVALVALVPLGGFGLLAGLTVSLSSTVGIAVLALLVLVFGALLAVAWAFVQVPVVTYLRYYALFVLGDVEPRFDLVPRQRADIRRER